MATLYIDFENGNDNYGGDSFGLLASGTDGRITVITGNANFVSASANFPNDGSLIGKRLSIFTGSAYSNFTISQYISSTTLYVVNNGVGPDNPTNQTVDRQYYIGGRWKNITTGALAARTGPGDTIRIMGSPAPTSLGQNGVWTSQALQAARVISSSTNATPISVTTNSAHGFSTGDTVVITSHVTNTNANGTWEITVTGASTFTLDGSTGNGVGSAGNVRLRNNTRVKLASAVTQNIASTGPGRAAWTASANAVASLSTSIFKEHGGSDSFVAFVAFTTGKLAYYTLPTTLDLSAYQQVSFWVQGNNVALTAGQIEIRLCSDATGDTVVNTISVPAIAAASRWMPVTVDLGSALGSSIASIAVFVNSDLSTTASAGFYLNNIIACKASSEPDSMTLTSLIGKNTTGETFWGIQSINGTRVMLDADTNATPISTTVRGYYGTNETVTTWKRETIKLGPAASSTTPLQVVQEDGADGSPITYSGGWDRTAMTTQNLETWLDGQNGNGSAISTSSRNWIQLQRISGSRFGSLIALGAASGFGNHTLGSITNCTSNSIDNATSSRFYSIEVDFIVAASGTGFTKNATASNNGSLKINNGILSCGTSALDIQSGKFRITGVAGQTLLANNSTSAIGGSTAELFASNLKTESNDSAAITSAGGSNIFLTNCLFNESQEVATIPFTAFAVYSHNHDQVANNHKIFTDFALISAATDQRHTASGISWKIQPTSTNHTSARPVILSLAKVACAANSLVTIKAWMRRTNTGLTMRLVCKGGQIAGVASDVVSAMTAAANTWEELTITFTPTEVGVVEITAEAWGGTTFSGWVDNMTITQA